jgi:membrane protease YdiL (CAAX protease family)
VAVSGGTASHFPGLLGPLLAAVVVTWRRAPLRHLATLRAAWRWWALALSPLGLAAAVVGAAALVGHSTTGSFMEMPGLPAGWNAWAVVAVVLLVNGVSEEAGWRGCAWPRLRVHLGLRDAALVLTAPWAVWHLPLFWIDSGLAGLPVLLVPGWLVGLASGAVCLGWLYERSGSVLVVAVAHTCVNLASGTAGGEGIASVAVSAAVIAAAAWVLRSAPTHGSRPGPRVSTGSPGTQDPREVR